MNDDLSIHVSGVGDESLTRFHYFCTRHGNQGKYVGMAISWKGIPNKQDVERKYCGDCCVEFLDVNLCQLVRIDE